MICAVCLDKGFVKVCYRDDEQPEQTFDVAICLCETGQRMRKSRSGSSQTTFPLWRVWAIRNGLEVSRMVNLEDVHEPGELSAMFGRQATQAAQTDDITEAGLTRRKRL